MWSHIDRHKRIRKMLLGAFFGALGGGVSNIIKSIKSITSLAKLILGIKVSPILYAISTNPKDMDVGGLRDSLGTTLLGNRTNIAWATFKAVIKKYG
jgi:hypothetical protein